jgi:hypothetical protein
LSSADFKKNNHIVLPCFTLFGLVSPCFWGRIRPASAAPRSGVPCEDFGVRWQSAASRQAGISPAREVDKPKRTSVRAKVAGPKCFRDSRRSPKHFGGGPAALRLRPNRARLNHNFIFHPPMLPQGVGQMLSNPRFISKIIFPLESSALEWVGSRRLRIVG